MVRIFKTTCIPARRIGCKLTDIIFLPALANRAQIAAGAKCAASSRQNHHIDFEIVFHSRQRIFQRQNQICIECVHALRPVQSQKDDATFALR
jgi:hypothetical protein